MRRRLSPGIIVPLIIAGLLATFAIVGAFASNETARVGSEDRDPAGPSLASTEGSAGTAAGLADADRDAQETSSGGGGAIEPASKAASGALLPSGQKLVRTGQLSVIVTEGKLLGTIDRIGVMTAGMGGYIMSSSVGGVTIDEVPAAGTSASDDVRSAEEDLSRSSEPESSVAPNQAWIALRVPQRSFNDAVKRFSALGQVAAVSTSSDDVTAQYVDVRAQLRHHRAVERRLLRFLAETTTIREMFTVQDRLDAVQLTIEQLEAQIKSLDETTTFATLSISLEERGTPQPGQIDDSDTFAGVFWNSLTLLGRGARLTGLAATAALPFVIVLGGLGLATWYVIRWLRLRRQVAEQPPSPV